MSRDYTGLHKFEWGYFLATSLAIVILISLFFSSRRPTRGGPASGSFDLTALAVFSATAIGIAANAWFFENRIGNILYWMLPLAFIIISVANSAYADTDKAESFNFDNLLTRIAFAGLAAFIALHFIEHSSTYQPNLSRTSQISENLSQTQRALLQSIIDPLFLAGLAALAVATIGSLISLVKKLQSSGNRWNMKTTAILILVMALPSFYTLRLAAGENEGQLLGVNIINFTFVVFFAILTVAAAFFIYFSFDDLRDNARGSEKGFVTNLLLISAIYSLTPFTSGRLGNLPVLLFWIAMSAFIATIMVPITQKNWRAYYLRKFAQVVAFVAVTCMFLSELALESSEYVSAQVFRPFLQFIYNTLYDMRGSLQEYSSMAALIALVLGVNIAAVLRLTPPSRPACRDGR